MTDFSNQTVFITGAASGIGRAAAVAFSAAGAKVSIADINAEGLAKTASSLDGDVLQTLLNVSDRDACFAAIAQTVEHFGGLNVLCNVAGVVQAENFLEITGDDWDRLLGINLSSVFHLSQAAMPSLIESKGNIVNLASVSGLMGQAYTASYCATKAGVVMLTKSLALEFAKQGVRVNCICPGAVNTAITDNFVLPKDVDFTLMQRYMPITEGSEPEEIAAAMMYLASPAAKSINGIALPMDGGVTAG